jgi:hypothetical protein
MSENTTTHAGQSTAQQSTFLPYALPGLYCPADLGGLFLRDDRLRALIPLRR